MTKDRLTVSHEGTSFGVQEGHSTRTLLMVTLFSATMLAGLLAYASLRVYRAGQWPPPGWHVIYTMSMHTGRHLGGTMQDHPKDHPLFSDCCTAEIRLLISLLSDKGYSDTSCCRSYEHWRQKYRVRTAHTEWDF